MLWGKGGGGHTCTCMCACMLEVKRKMLNEVLSCVYAISWVHCALDCINILMTILFLYCALRAHIRYKPLITTTSHENTHYKHAA